MHFTIINFKIIMYNSPEKNFSTNLERQDISVNIIHTDPVSSSELNDNKAKNEEDYLEVAQKISFKNDLYKAVKTINEIIETEKTFCKLMEIFTDQVITVVKYEKDKTIRCQYDDLLKATGEGLEQLKNMPFDDVIADNSDLGATINQLYAILMSSEFKERIITMATIISKFQNLLTIPSIKDTKLKDPVNGKDVYHNFETGLQELLILPMQRVTRYPILLQSLSESLSFNVELKGKIDECLDRYKVFAQTINVMLKLNDTFATPTKKITRHSTIFLLFKTPRKVKYNVAHSEIIGSKTNKLIQNASNTEQAQELKDKDQQYAPALSAEAEKTQPAQQLTTIEKDLKTALTDDTSKVQEFQEELTNARTIINEQNQQLNVKDQQLSQRENSALIPINPANTQLESLIMTASQSELKAITQIKLLCQLIYDIEEDYLTYNRPVFNKQRIETVKVLVNAANDALKQVKQLQGSNQEQIQKPSVILDNLRKLKADKLAEVRKDHEEKAFFAKSNAYLKKHGLTFFATRSKLETLLVQEPKTDKNRLCYIN